MVRLHSGSVIGREKLQRKFFIRLISSAEMWFENYEVLIEIVHLDPPRAYPPELLFCLSMLQLTRHKRLTNPNYVTLILFCWKTASAVWRAWIFIRKINCGPGHRNRDRDDEIDDGGLWELVYRVYVIRWKEIVPRNWSWPMVKSDFAINLI